MDSKELLHRQLIKLGDMMGDGLHHEADGKWISREYSKTLKALGMAPKRKSNPEAINFCVNRALKLTRCSKCESELKQTRSGAFTVKCVSCDSRFKFKKNTKK